MRYDELTASYSTSGGEAWNGGKRSVDQQHADAPLEIRDLCLRGRGAVEPNETGEHSIVHIWTNHGHRVASAKWNQSPDQRRHENYEGFTLDGYYSDSKTHSENTIDDILLIGYHTWNDSVFEK